MWGWKRAFESRGYERQEAAEMATSVYDDWHRKDLHGKHNIQADERGAIRAVLDLSAWTEARCCEAGYPQFPICKWCQGAVGNMRHRLFGCPRLEEVGGKG